MFCTSPEFTSQNIGCFHFCTRRARVFDKKICTTPVIKCPQYLNAVMQNYCIRKSKVSSKMYSTRLMGDGCFNNIVDKTFCHFCVLLCHMHLASIETLNLPEIATSLKKISRLFNNVHL